VRRHTAAAATVRCSCPWFHCVTCAPPADVLVKQPPLKTSGAFSFKVRL
jgi:hypothetical protein